MNATTSSSATVARQLVDRLSSRLANEKRELVLFLIELAEFDAKKVALELGYPSTLGCLVGELGLTESSACRRIAAARLLSRFPQIAPHLLASRLTLMGLVALKEVLDESSVDEVLERAAGLSELELRELVMRIRFADAAPPTSVEIAPGQQALATAPAASVAADRVATSHRSESSAECAPAEQLEAVTLWVGRGFREELAAVRTLLSHAVPSGKREDVLLHVLRAQRKSLERRRHGSAKRATARAAASDTNTDAQTNANADANAQTNANANANAQGTATTDANPSTNANPSTKTNQRYIPAALRREVYEREGGTCAYVGEEGRRCCSTQYLEYQHIVPFARGGRTTADNLTLFCRAHNLLQAERDFGAAHVTQQRAICALTNLGYKRGQAEHAVTLLLPTTELAALIRDCLRLLA